MDSKEKAISIMKACGQTLYTDELSDMKFLIEEGYDASEICNYLDVSKREYRETIRYILEVGKTLDGQVVKILKTPNVDENYNTSNLQVGSTHTIIESPYEKYGNYLKSVWVQSADGRPVRLSQGEFEIVNLEKAFK